MDGAGQRHELPSERGPAENGARWTASRTGMRVTRAHMRERHVGRGLTALEERMDSSAPSSTHRNDECSTPEGLGHIIEGFSI
jgi:hypothetical protein